MRKIWRFLIVFVISIAATMLHIGGTNNLLDFLEAGRVYDFLKADLIKPSSTWIYNAESNDYVILENKALNKYLLNEQEETWNYLYINIEKLNIEQLSGYIYYYNSDNQKVSEQPIVLNEGENIVMLLGECPMYRMGICLIDRAGSTFKISSMQLRTTALGFSASRFGKIFVICFIVGIVFLGIFNFFEKKYKREIHIDDCCCGVIYILQTFFKVFGDYAGSRMGGRLRRAQANDMRIFLFCCLWTIMIVGNMTGWSTEQTVYKYYILLYILLILLLAFVSWERPLKRITWNSWQAKTWIMIGMVMIISDYVVSKDIKFAGYILFLSIGFLIFVWNQMKYSNQMLSCLIRSLQITFWIGLAFCILFRPTVNGIGYNGLFADCEQNAIYGTIMTITFLASVYGENKNYIRNISGVFLSVCLVFLSKEVFCQIVTAGVMVCWFFIIIYRKIKRKDLYNLLEMVRGMAIAMIAVLIMQGALRTIPVILNLDVECANEVYVTNIEDEYTEPVKYQLQEMGRKGTVYRENEIPRKNIWRTYIRRWGAFGKNGIRKTSRQKTPVYNEYIGMSYRYGIFMLIPYIMYQIAVLRIGIKKTREGYLPMYVFFLILCYILLNGVQNMGAFYSQPAMFLFFFLPGVWFVETNEG